ncbi:MAG: sugar transferase [Patescibacteria group bacterium]|jgi:exopolysaccharide biosynthesis polyprenyl glycosylphosphotransferase
MKKIELLFSAILVPLDYLMVLLAGWLAYRIRFTTSVTGIYEVLYPLSFTEFFHGLLICGFFLLIIFAWNGLYDIAGTRRVLDEFRKIFVACSTGITFVIIFLFFNRELFSSRFIILTTWAISIVLVALMRFTVIQIERFLLKRGLGAHQVLLIGDNRTARVLNDTITRYPQLGLRVVERANKITMDLFTKLEKIIKLKQVDEVIVTDPDFTRAQANQLIQFCKVHHLQFKYAADLFDAQITNMTIRPLAGIPIVEVHNTALRGWGRIVKRSLDLVFSAFVLILISPLLAGIALAIKIESTGPVIYRNRRIGENGKPFDTYKFRSMFAQYCIGEQFDSSNEALKLEQQLITEKSIKVGPLYKIKNDPRVTKVGRFIRRTSLDELPQFANVLLGQMSIIGPRPHQPREVAKYTDQHKIVLNMKPGITGLAQIFGRSDLDFEEEVNLDIYYMENWSIWLDLYISFKTPLAMFKEREAL